MPEYRSRERVYNLDDAGEPYSLRFAVGDVIPEDEARRQGLVPGTDDAKRRPQAADKARRSAADKTRS